MMGFQVFVRWGYFDEISDIISSALQQTRTQHRNAGFIIKN
jgi:hypothetical protein